MGGHDSRRAWVFILRLMLRIIDSLGPMLSRLFSRRIELSRESAGSGISVIIPERANPRLLSECLESLMRACQAVAEPVEVIVVVNGSRRSTYEPLRTRYPSVRWLFFDKPLWFGGAVREGLKAACHAWVYLLNNDMTVDPLALSELLCWRSPQVFAVASQIFFMDPARRREETGWTRFRESDGMIEIFDVEPEEELVRGTFYAGGGASLFQASVLRRLVPMAAGYEPFYWEDVEWGTVAWRWGFESLFCPRSRVWHHHRSTNRVFFPEKEIERVFLRNKYRYELRNRVLGAGCEARLFEHLFRLDRLCFREITTLRSVAGILLSRLRYWTYPFREVPLQYTWRKYYPTTFCAAAEKPTILFVTPYAIYPPSHGGAVRLHNLISAISRDFSVVLLSDEADRYSQCSLKYFAHHSSVHLVAGRSDDVGVGKIQRICSHSHSDLKAVLEMLVARYAPSLVQLEFVELAKLADLKQGPIPWLLTLHEAWTSKGASAATAEERHETALVGKFDAVITCSTEDAQLVDHPNVHVVPNGAEVCASYYVPSPESAPILFIGPFRYQPNLLGIRSFLETIYPKLLKSISGLRLWVLGGNGAAAIASGMKCFDQPGVTVMEYVEQPRLLLDQCAITINPLHGVRGSCLKVAESIVAGRMCVTTTEGARGFLGREIPALTVVDRVSDFEAPIQLLLCDAARRWSLEKPSPAVLAFCSWENGARELLAIYSRMTGRSLCTTVQRLRPH